MKLADLASLRLTYEPVGRTLDGPFPDGFHHMQVQGRLGSGEAAYRRAADAVMTFRAQRGLGTRPQSTAPRAAEGVEVLSRLLVLPVPCRVVWATEGADRTGFGYGTLEGHPASGEEAFLAERRGDEVWGVIRAYSVPVSRVARWGGPVTSRLQDLAARGYLAALGRAVREGR